MGSTDKWKTNLEVESEKKMLKKSFERKILEQ